MRMPPRDFRGSEGEGSSIRNGSSSGVVTSQASPSIDDNNTKPSTSIETSAALEAILQAAGIPADRVRRGVQKSNSSDSHDNSGSGSRRNGLNRSKSCADIKKKKKTKTLGDLLERNNQAPGNTAVEEAHTPAGGGLVENVIASKEEMLDILNEASINGGFGGDIKVANVPIVSKLHSQFPVCLSPSRKGRGGEMNMLDDGVSDPGGAGLRLLSASVPNLDYNMDDEDEDGDGHDPGRNYDDNMTLTDFSVVDFDEKKKDSDAKDNLKNDDRPSGGLSNSLKNLPGSGDGAANNTARFSGNSSVSSSSVRGPRSPSSPRTRTVSEETKASAVSKFAEALKIEKGVGVTPLGGSSHIGVVPVGSKHGNMTGSFHSSPTKAGGGGGAASGGGGVSGSNHGGTGHHPTHNMLNMDAAAIKNKRDKLAKFKMSGPNPYIQRQASRGKGRLMATPKKEAEEEHEPEQVDHHQQHHQQQQQEQQQSQGEAENKKEQGIQQQQQLMAQLEDPQSPEKIKGESAKVLVDGFAKAREEAELRRSQQEQISEVADSTHSTQSDASEMSSASSASERRSNKGKLGKHLGKKAKQKIKINPSQLGLTEEEAKDPVKLQEAFKKWKREHRDELEDTMSVMSEQVSKAGAGGSGDAPPSPTKQAGRSRLARELDRIGGDGSLSPVKQKRSMSRGRPSSSATVVGTSDTGSGGTSSRRPSTRGRSSAEDSSSNLNSSSSSLGGSKLRRRRSMSRGRVSAASDIQSAAELAREFDEEQNQATAKEQSAKNERSSSGSSIGGDTSEDQPKMRRARSLSRVKSARGLSKRTSVAELMEGNNNGGKKPTDSMTVAESSPTRKMSRRSSLESTTSAATEVRGRDRESVKSRIGRSKSLGRPAALAAEKEARLVAERTERKSRTTSTDSDDTGKSAKSSSDRVRSKSRGRIREPREDNEPVKPEADESLSPTKLKPSVGRRGSLDNTMSSVQSSDGHASVSRVRSKSKARKTKSDDGTVATESPTSRGRTKDGESSGKDKTRSKSRGRKLATEGEGAKPRARSRDVRKDKKEKSMSSIDIDTPKTPPKPEKRSVKSTSSISANHDSLLGNTFADKLHELPPSTPVKESDSVLGNGEVVTPTESVTSKSEKNRGGITSRISALKSAFLKGGNTSTRQQLDDNEDMHMSMPLPSNLGFTQKSGNASMAANLHLSQTIENSSSANGRPSLTNAVPAPSMRVIGDPPSPSGSSKSSKAIEHGQQVEHFSPRKASSSFSFWSQKAGQSSHESPSPPASPIVEKQILSEQTVFDVIDEAASSKNVEGHDSVASQDMKLQENGTLEWAEVDFTALGAPGGGTKQPYVVRRRRSQLANSYSDDGAREDTETTLPETLSPSDSGKTVAADLESEADLLKKLKKAGITSKQLNKLKMAGLKITGD